MASTAAQAAINVLRLPPLPTIKDILKIYKLRAMKQLSQNFILDYKLTNKIVKSAGKLKDCHVLEVGPGPGGITRAILEHGAKKLIVVEKDTRFKPCLELLADAVPNQMEIVYGDILETDLSKVFPGDAIRDWTDYPPPIHVIGNLPFNVSTPLIICWLKAMSERSGIFSYGRVGLTLTFQHEVAERMVADILDPQRCRLSIMCQHLAKVDYKFTISGSACVPKPDVDIGVVRFTPLIEPLIKQPFPLVEKIMRHIFHHRQKYIRFGIRTLFPDHLKDLTDGLCKDAEVDPTCRSFELSIEELGRLCDAYARLCDEYEGLLKYDYRAFPDVLELKKRLEDDNFDSRNL